jgi:hypothetical protein
MSAESRAKTTVTKKPRTSTRAAGASMQPSRAGTKGEGATNHNASTKQRTDARRIKQRRYRSFKLSPRIKHPIKLPSEWHLLKVACRTLWEGRKVLLGIGCVYLLLGLPQIVGSANSSEVQQLKQAFDAALTNNWQHIISGLSIFSFLVASSSSGASNNSGVTQTLVLVFISLVVIWSLRQITAKVAIRVRDAFYLGTYPMVQFTLVLLVIGLQLVPFIVAANIYSYVIDSGLAVLVIEKVLWGLLLALVALLSLYMISSSIFALYIVTLPDMTPMKALKSARELVKYRRWTVLRKVIFLPIALLLAGAVIMLPVILWFVPLAAAIFYILSIFALIVFHAYLYALYRELLRE